MDLGGRWRMSKWTFGIMRLSTSSGLHPSICPSGTGSFRFIAVEGFLDCQYEDTVGRPAVQFTWDKRDECDPASGRGWAALEEDGSL